MSTYTILVADILAYTENTDPSFTASIDKFISNAERRIYADVELPAERVHDTSQSTAIGVSLVTLPTGFLFTYGINITVPAVGAKFLMRKEIEYIREMYPLTTYTARPQVYAQYDDTRLLIGPAPDAVYPIDIEYSKFPNGIIISGESWLGTNYYQLLLYGVLLEADTFMKGVQDMAARYLTAYQNDLETLRSYVAKTKQDNYRP